jgi:hypothetical protein
MAEGMRWLARHPLLRTLALLVGVNTFCFQLGSVTLVLLATQTLHLSTRGFGVLLAGAAIGCRWAWRCQDEWRAGGDPAAG